MSLRLVSSPWLLLIPVALWLAGCSSNDETPVVAPEDETTAPAAPEFLIVSDTNPAFIRLKWEDVSGDETGFRIESSLQETAGFSVLDTVAADVTQYTHDEVEAGGRYYYRLRAYRAGIQSRPTPVVWGEAVDNAAPAPPSEPSPEDGAEGRLPGQELAWRGSDPEGDELTYTVYLGTSLFAVDPVSIQVADTSYTPADSLDLNRRYFWRVKAADVHGAAALSPTWSFATQIERVLIEEGYFFMGDTLEFPHPGNPVYVTAFNMDKFEVTNQQYADFLNQARRGQLIRHEGGRVYDLPKFHIYCDLTSYDPDSKIDYEASRRIFVVAEGWEDRPVTEVSWYGAQAFAGFYGRRLPTEAEWEKAARGTGNEFGDTLFVMGPDTVLVGFGRPYPWGDEATPQHANYRNSGDPYETTLGVGTTPVGFYDGSARGGLNTRDNAGPYGAYDLAGNVYEWTADWFAEYRNPHRPPDQPTTSHLKVIRGGSWRKGPESMKTWIRNASFPDSTDNSIGFRTVARP